MSMVFEPETYGAVGDGVTNDDGAMKAMAAAVAAAGGGTMRFTSGKTYIVGVQTTGGTWHREMAPPLSFIDVPFVEIDLNGATLKLAGGHKFGSFDASTGAAINPTMPHIAPSTGAKLAPIIYGEDCAVFKVHDGTIDLNSSNVILGGGYGDTGRQLPCYGVETSNCFQVLWDNVSVSNSALDGFGYVYRIFSESAVPPTFVMRRCRVSAVARNCVSYTAGKGALIEACSFRDAGAAPHPSGVIKSAPASGFDVEAEGGSLIRDITIRNCEFISAATSNTCFVADSGDTKGINIEDCLLDGLVWTTKDRTIFRNCRINGAFAKLRGGQPDLDANTLIEGCTFNDAASAQDVTSFVGNSINTQWSGTGIRIVGTTINAANLRLFLAHAVLEQCQINWSGGTNIVGLSELVPAISLNAAHCTDLQIIESIPTAHRPATAYWISTDSDTVLRGDCEVVTPNNKLAFYSANVAPGYGHAGKTANEVRLVDRIRFNKRVVTDPSTSGSYGYLDVTANNAPPTTGTHERGKFILNDTPSANGILGWVCVAAGAPGSWVAVRAVQQQPAIADIGAAPTQSDFNNLLSALRTAGVIAP